MRSLDEVIDFMKGKDDLLQKCFGKMKRPSAVRRLLEHEKTDQFGALRVNNCGSSQLTKAFVDERGVL